MPADWTYAGRRGFYSNGERTGRGYLPTREEVIKLNGYDPATPTVDVVTYEGPRLWFKDDQWTRASHCSPENIEIAFVLCAECDTPLRCDDYLCESCRGNLS